jgi:hypothetical protein
MPEALVVLWVSVALPELFPVADTEPVLTGESLFVSFESPVD